MTQQLQHICAVESISLETVQMLMPPRIWNRDGNVTTRTLVITAKACDMQGKQVALVDGVWIYWDND
jgi:hypothetical protein